MADETRYGYQWSAKPKPGSMIDFNWLKPVAGINETEAMTAGMTGAQAPDGLWSRIGNALRGTGGAVVDSPLGQASKELGYWTGALERPEAVAAKKATADANKKAQSGVQMYNEALSGMLKPPASPGQVNFNIPGAGIGGMPRAPNLPLPDFAAGRTALEAARPGPAVPITEEEGMQRTLAGLAAGAAQGTTVGNTLAMAGAGMLGAKAGVAAEKRKLEDLQQERQRSFNQQLASFEVNEVKQKYEAQWRQETLKFQANLQAWTASRPKVNYSTQGVIVQSFDKDGGVDVKMIPWSTAIGASANSLLGRKGAGLVGADAWKADYMKFMSQYPPGDAGQVIGKATWAARRLFETGVLLLPASADSDKDSDAWKRNQERLGAATSLNQKTITQFWQQAQAVVAQQGLNPGSKEGSEALRNVFYQRFGAFLSEPSNAQLLLRFYNLAFGSNG